MSDLSSRLTAALTDRYRLESELGQGGMATVYLAADLKHDRQVAIKVLKPELAAVLGADRFVQEIKTTAALQHPHILPLFDSGSADSFLYYVMPYVEGETLRTRLEREKQLGVEEAVRISREVADALDYAHRHGVIHRDIKPENILLHDGRPMVADFGIALAVSAAAGGRMTETGLSLGTPHYMSPEQATADRDITARSDIYSLASVLYEMLTGEPPHMGNSAQQIIMKIIADPARPVTELRHNVPPNVAAALTQALEKLPADRFDSAKAFADALANPAFTTATTGALAVAARSSARRRTAIVMAAFLAIAALAAWGWLRSRPAGPVIAYGLALPPGQEVTDLPVVAPDGSFMVYAGRAPGDRVTYQLWLKRRDAYSASPIPGTLGATSVVVSPDGRSIAFVAVRQLKRLALAGGAPAILVDSASNGDGLAWLDDGTIAYVTAGGAPTLRLVPAGGGASRLISRADSLGSVDPVALPGGRGLLFSRCSAGGQCTEWAYDLRQDTARMIAGIAGGARYASSGHLLYIEGATLLAAPFDLGRLEVTRSPVTVADSVIGFTLSRSGTLVLAKGASGLAGPSYQLVWVDRAGHQTPVDSSFTFHLTGAFSDAGWALSPDGKRLAIGLNTAAGDDIWLKPLPRGVPSRVTFDPAPDYRPHWTHDGRSIVFASGRAPYGVYQRRADGTGSATLLAPTPLDPQEAVLAGDGAWLLARVGGNPGPGGRDIIGRRLGLDSTWRPVLVTPFDEEAIAPSPDGRWLAYQSNETGQTEVFIRSFPDLQQQKLQVSSGGGVAPLWSRDGRELLYMSKGHDMMAVRLGAGSVLAAGNPVKLFHLPDELLQVETAYYTPWDVAPDGRFIMARALATGGASTGPMVVVVENFLQNLQARMRH